METVAQVLEMQLAAQRTGRDQKRSHHNDNHVITDMLARIETVQPETERWQKIAETLGNKAE